MTRCKFCNEAIGLNDFHWCGEELHAAAATPPAYSIPAACQQRPCFTCGKPTPDEVCAKCVPEPLRQPHLFDDLPGNRCVYCMMRKDACLSDLCPLPVPTACVPDDAQQESYEQRRARKAAERNPHGKYLREQAARDAAACDYFRRAIAGMPIADTRGEGIARAVDRLSQHEHRVGAAKFQP
jgi:hypothetical protein